MTTKRFLLNSIMILVLVFGFLSPNTLSPLIKTPVVKAATATTPVVAIHVSELTQALETMPAVAPTPTGTGYTGFEWFYTSWHYFVIPESLKIALESDGTPYAIVTDADIAAGALMDGVSPKYPIVFSLASEAINNNEIQPLRDYVNAGGFLFIGSSSFTRNPDGTTRGNFALADQMGLNMVTTTLQNWTMNLSFTHTVDHRLVSHIPLGTVTWDMLTNAEDVVWGSNGSQHLWRTAGDGAEVIATGSGFPLLATHGYGMGRFIYHSILNPLVGAGGYDSGMYAYTIYRNAIEWAFEAANLPIIKSSPWPYAFDSAFMVRHDFENYLSAVGGGIETSAAYEQSVGAKGDYYFCTGILRTLDPSLQQPYIDSIRRAVANYGATIGSHNGGYPNIGATDPGSYDYWHWGPDTMFDRDPSVFPTPYTGTPTAAYDFSKDSIQISFDDLERWLAGTDNGREGCGAAGNCPRTWVSPYFNSGRDRSFKIFEELGAAVMGEQKVSPFPHWTLSYDPANSDHRYAVVTLPPSDWYVGTGISQSIEGHNTASIQALVDFYSQKGYLMNLYGHSGSSSGNMKTYVDYAVSNPHTWATNAVELYDWWVKRSSVVVIPSYTKIGETATVSAAISGATDAQTAVEVVIPNWSSGAISNVVVMLGGVPADPSQYRSTNYGIKVLVGTAITNVTVSYAPLEGWVQTDWVGGAGQATWSDPTRYDSSTNINDDVAGQFSLNLAAGGAPLFSDDFNRENPMPTPTPTPPPAPFSWTIPAIAGNGFSYNTNGGTLNTSLTVANLYGYAYKDVPSQPAGDYTIETDISFPFTLGSGGGGIFGRLDPSTGTRYAVWIYPGSTTLRLIRFPSWAGTGWVAVGNATIPAVGTGWHHLKMVFSGSNIQVFYDNSATPSINATDTNFTAGFVGVDYWSTNTNGPSYNNYIVKDNTGTTIFEDNFGDDPVAPPDPPSLLPPWTVYTGSWAVLDYALQSTAAGLGGYANIYYNPSPTWTDYSVQARVQYPSGAFGGGLVGRLDPVTGTRYTAWVYPGTSILNLLQWSDWDSWTSLTSASIPAVGTGWHTVKMDFSSSSIRVYWDGSLLIDTVDSTSPYLSGGIGFDTYTGSPTYLMAADDVVVSGPDQYEVTGVLTSSGFDGGVGAEYYDISWTASIPASTSICVRTRTADSSAALASAVWSSCYATSGTPVTSTDRRWIQYQVELSTSDPAVTPVFYENGITYTPGSYLPQSFLTNNSPVSGDSQTTVSLSATLRDELNVPIVGRTIRFAVDGLPFVTGTTDSSGIAVAPILLDIAPGQYPLTITFESDGVYGSSSDNSSFTVTESWSEWIQDNTTDFSTGTGGCFDIIDPGTLVLDNLLFGEGEETGSFTIGPDIYGYRHRLFIDNPNPTALPVGYTLKLVVDTAALVTSGKLLSSGDDLRLVQLVEGTPLELDRVADTAFNSAATEILFKTQTAIAAGVRDSSYYLYYGRPTASAPPSNPANVFALYDGFDDDTINLALWTRTGTISESDGWAHLSAGSDLYGLQPFTYGLLEMRIETASEGNYMWWGWEDGPADAPNFIVFEDYPSGLAALLRNDNAAYQTLTLSAQPAGGLIVPHVYATEWRPGQARWYVDGVQVQSASTGVPDSPMRANFNANVVAYNLDWVRGRLRVAQEPIVALASAFTAYVNSCTFTSVPQDTGGISDWKYLVWEGLQPPGTTLTLRLRTAATSDGLASATWIDYPQSGLLISNPSNRWVQYEANLSTTDSLVTPALNKITIYYIQSPTAVTLASFSQGSLTNGVQLNWSTATEIGLLGFNLFRADELAGVKEKLNANLIPALSPGDLLGNAYQFTDVTAVSGKTYSYWVELVMLDGNQYSDPITVQVPYWSWLPITLR